jgi:hypothetical protein
MSNHRHFPKKYREIGKKNDFSPHIEAVPLKWLLIEQQQSPVWTYQARQAAQQSGFTGAICAENGDDLPGSDLEGGAIQRAFSVIRLADRLQLNLHSMSKQTIRAEILENNGAA